MSRPFALASLLLLAACAGEAPRPAVTPAAPPPLPATSAGLERVMGRPAPALLDLFGRAELDLREGPARKIQFRGPACVLDAYLYPPPAGGEARVTFLDARTPRGIAFDRASCVAALSRRMEARTPTPPAPRGPARPRTGARARR
jgi:hypothetical protein